MRFPLLPWKTSLLATAFIAANAVAGHVLVFRGFPEGGFPWARALVTLCVGLCFFSRLAWPSSERSFLTRAAFELLSCAMLSPAALGAHLIASLYALALQRLSLFVTLAKRHPYASLLFRALIAPLLGLSIMAQISQVVWARFPDVAWIWALSHALLWGVWEISRSPTLLHSAKGAWLTWGFALMGAMATTRAHGVLAPASANLWPPCPWIRLQWFLLGLLGAMCLRHQIFRDQRSARHLRRGAWWFLVLFYLIFAWDWALMP
jgi:hypothetical protein